MVISGSSFVTSGAGALKICRQVSLFFVPQMCQLTVQIARF